MSLDNTVFLEEGALFSPEIQDKHKGQFISHQQDITAFCKRSGCKLQRVDITNEKGYEEMLYFFDDDLGGYTIEAIRKSP